MTDRRDKFDALRANPMFQERTDLDGMGMIVTPEPTRCPKCASGDLRQIVYGLPAEPLDPEVYHLGGCVVGDADWWCATCQHEW